MSNLQRCPFNPGILEWFDYGTNRYAREQLTNGSYWWYEYNRSTNFLKNFNNEMMANKRELLQTLEKEYQQNFTKTMERFTAENARTLQRKKFTKLYDIYELIKKEVERENNPLNYLVITVNSHEYYEENPEKWDYISKELAKDGYSVHYNEYSYEYHISW